MLNSHREAYQVWLSSVIDPEDVLDEGNIIVSSKKKIKKKSSRIWIIAIILLLIVIESLTLYETY